MSDKLQKKRLSILRVLQGSARPLGSSKITERLSAMGQETSERTVRFYLLGMDRDGLTENLGKRGRRITALGQRELEDARVVDKVGLLAAKIDNLTYRMSFSLSRRKGTVVVNVSLIERGRLKRAVPQLHRVFSAGYAMGRLLTVLHPGERLGDLVVPEGMVGIGTVCSITLNGVLLANGIPTNSRFGGLLEIQNHQPKRFVEFIHYDGTTLDPMEVFIRSGMTDYEGAVETGNGRIGASFREIPADSREKVVGLAKELSRIGLGGVMLIGWPGRPLLEIPVTEGRLGLVVIGGLNPVGLLEEQGVRIQSRAMAGLADFKSLFPYQALAARLASVERENPCALADGKRAAIA